MTFGASYSRRRFLQASAALAACGLAPRARAHEASQDSLIDTHVYVGRWPFARLPGDEPQSLVEILQEHGVTRAWAGSFDALFHKDIDGVNRRLVKTCNAVGAGFLIPIGAVNPTLPDWEEDLRRCHEKYRMPGVRLHPNYHGYKLDDPRFARLMELAAERNLLVQLVAHVSEESHSLLSPNSPRVDFEPLLKMLEPQENVRLLVSGADDRSVRKFLQNGPSNLRICFDDLLLVASQQRSEAQKLVSPENVAFGSCSPLPAASAAFELLDALSLKDGQRQALMSGNAARLLAPRS